MAGDQTRIGAHDRVLHAADRELSEAVDRDGRPEGKGLGSLEIDLPARKPRVDVAARLSGHAFRLPTFKLVGQDPVAEIQIGDGLSIARNSLKFRK